MNLRDGRVLCAVGESGSAEFCVSALSLLARWRVIMGGVIHLRLTWEEYLSPEREREGGGGVRRREREGENRREGRGEERREGNKETKEEWRKKMVILLPKHIYAHPTTNIVYMQHSS